ncbi:MAG: hypothetical protein QXN33_03520 [Candidatus Bathyarchaeia archaeon]
MDPMAFQLAIICGILSGGISSLFKRRNREGRAQAEAIGSARAGSLEELRRELALPMLRRQIASFAVDALRDAVAKGMGGPGLRSLLERYEEELRALDEALYPREVELKILELEGAKARLREFLEAKIGEIDSKIAELRRALELGERVKLDFEAPRPEDYEGKAKALIKDLGGRAGELERELEAIDKEVLSALERLERLEAEG